MPTKKKPVPLPPGGWITEWLVLGSFPGAAAELLVTPLIDEPKVHPSRGESVKGRRWNVHAGKAPFIDLRGSSALTGPRDDCAAYAHVYLASDRQQDVELLVGSDDGCAIWLDGRRVFAREAMRGCVADEDTIPVTLAKGLHRLLIKVEQYGGAWGFMFRLTAPGREPVDGIGWLLDDPLGKGWKADPTSVKPCSLCVVTPQVLEYARAKPADDLGMAVVISNVSDRAVGPGVLSITSSAGQPIAGPAFGVIGARSAARVPVALPAAAWLDGVSIEARQAKRSVSPSATCRAGALAKFLVASKGTHNGGLDTATLERVRCDLSAGQDVLSDDHELTRAVSELSGTDLSAGVLANVDALLAKRGRTAKSRAVFLVGHAHIDMNWLWRWPETVQVCRDSFRQALRFIDEFPDFRFSQSQASVYEAMEREDPPLFEGIQRAVAAGKWEVTGGMWTEGDTNLSSGEALCRSFTLAQRYFREKLGVTAKTGWLPDNFGHVAQLPQILRLAGIDSFYHVRCRPQLPELYRWQSPNGSTVTAKTGQGYNDQVGPSIRHEPDRVPAIGSQMFVYGVGDHGGGPTRRDITTAKSLSNNRLFPELRLATTRDYFAHVERQGVELPVHEGELQFIFEGCYTNVSRVKQGNRRLENALQAVEALAIAASRLGLEIPRSEIQSTWKTLVFNQFHDILPGSAIHESNLDSVGRYQQALETCRLVRDRCLRFIGERVRISSDASIPLVVFNPLLHERTDVVVAEVITDSPLSALRITDASGAEIAAQIVKTRRFDAYDHLWVQFVAPGVPGLGYKVFFAQPERDGIAVPMTHWSDPYPASIPLTDDGGTLSVSGKKISSRFFDLVFDGKTGAITSLRLEGEGSELTARRGLNRLGMFLEHPHDMSAWNLDAAAEGPIDLTVTEPAQILQAGRESVTWVASFAYGASTFKLTTTVHADSPRIDCHLAVEWTERGTRKTAAPMLRVLHALAGKADSLVCDTPFAAILRPAGREVPAQKWVCVKTGKNIGMAMFNRGKYGHSLVDGALRLTLLRSAFDPDLLPDVGRHEIEWALLPYRGDWQKARVPLAALSYNVPFETFQARKQDGPLGLEHSVLSFSSPDEFVVTGAKPSEDGRGIVVRGYDLTGKGCTVRASGELTRASAERVDLLEDPVKDGHVSLRGISVEPYEIVSLRVD